MDRGAAELAIKVADRLMRPFGVSLISYTSHAVIPPAAGRTPQERFDTIAEQNAWGSAESLSGRGSELGQSAPYRAQLLPLLRRFNSMFDAPCGDMNWMQAVLDQVQIDYIGGDISPRIIELNRARFPHLQLDVFDITRDRFPAVQLWHCRDCLFHLSYRDIRAALDNFANSKIEYALITTHRGIVRNVDMETGGFRHLNLLRPPFNFPKPERMLSDYRFGNLPQSVGLWRRDALIRAFRSLETRDNPRR